MHHGDGGSVFEHTVHAPYNIFKQLSISSPSVELRAKYDTIKDTVSKIDVENETESMSAKCESSF